MIYSKLSALYRKMLVFKMAPIYVNPPCEWTNPTSPLLKAIYDSGIIKLCCVCGIVTSYTFCHYDHSEVKLEIPICSKHHCQFPNVNIATLKRMVCEAREQFISVIKFAAAQTSDPIVNANGYSFISRAQAGFHYHCYHPNCQVFFDTLEHLLRHENNHMRHQERRTQKMHLYQVHFCPWKHNTRNVYYSKHYLNCIVETVGTPAAAPFFSID